MFATSSAHAARRHAYAPPTVTSVVSLPACLALYVAGDTSLLDRPIVSVVGSRRASAEGLACAAQVATELVSRGYVVLSGLAAGIDAAAHEAAIRAGGRTIAVVGTSLDQVYPAQHAGLQERVYREHLLVSPFAAGATTARWHFPARNRVMARLAHATVLVEAGETSGTRHQVAACVAMSKPVFAHGRLVGHLSWLRDPGVISWSCPVKLGQRLVKASMPSTAVVS
jgi:DNA protecting protein DprA